MQMCPECERVYDESETPECPYCHPIDDRMVFTRPSEDEDDEDDRG